MFSVPSREIAWGTDTEQALKARQIHYVTQGSCLNLPGSIFPCVTVNINVTMAQDRKKVVDRMIICLNTPLYLNSFKLKTKTFTNPER